MLAVAGTPGPIYRWYFGNPVTRMLKRGVFAKMGMHDFKLAWFNAEDQSATKRTAKLAAVGKAL